MAGERQPGLWRPAPVDLIEDAASMPWTRLHQAPDLIGFLWAFDRAARGDPPTRREMEAAMGWGSTRAGRVLDDVVHRLAAWNGRQPETSASTAPNQPQTGRKPDIDNNQTSRKPAANQATPENIDIVDEPQTGRKPAANRPGDIIKPAANQPQTSAPDFGALSRASRGPLQEQEHLYQLQGHTRQGPSASLVEDHDQAKENSRPSIQRELGGRGLGEEPASARPGRATAPKSAALPPSPSAPPAAPAGPPDAGASVSRGATSPRSLFSHPIPSEPVSRPVDGPTAAPSLFGAPVVVSEPEAPHEAPAAPPDGVAMGAGVDPKKVTAAERRVYLEWAGRQASPGGCRLTKGRWKLIAHAIRVCGEPAILHLIAYAYEAPNEVLGTYLKAWRMECQGRPELEMLLRQERVEGNVERARRWQPGDRGSTGPDGLSSGLDQFVEAFNGFTR